MVFELEGLIEDARGLEGELPDGELPSFPKSIVDLLSCFIKDRSGCGNEKELIYDQTTT